MPKSSRFRNKSGGDRDHEVRVLFAAREGRQAAVVLEKALRRRTPWVVRHVSTGDAALRALETDQFTMLLFDSQLPVVQGAELCRILRDRPMTVQVPTIVIDFDGTNADEQTRAFMAGADDYVDATYGEQITVDRIRSVLLRKKTFSRREPTVVQYKNGRLVANFNDAYVSVDGRPLILQRLELSLLRYLVECRNRVITRQELLECVWNEKKTVHSRTIDVHVCRLRQKLGPVGCQIQTLVSLGYRFVDGDRSTE